MPLKPQVNIVKLKLISLKNLMSPVFPFTANFSDSPFVFWCSFKVFPKKYP